MRLLWPKVWALESHGLSLNLDSILLSLSPPVSVFSIFKMGENNKPYVIAWLCCEGEVNARGVFRRVRGTQGSVVLFVTVINKGSGSATNCLQDVGQVIAPTLSFSAAISVNKKLRLHH